jgi:Uma2 family endonuclease
MTDAASKPMTVAEFLTWNDGTDTRYGLVCGRVVAMAPVSPDHSINHRVANLGALESGLNRPCYVGIEAGMVRPDRDDTFYEADIVVSCTPLAPGMAVILDPVAVVEVLSPSTIEHDRGRKAYDYRRIESVQEIVLVPSRREVGGRGPDRRRRARARGRGDLDPAAHDLRRQRRVAPRLQVRRRRACRRRPACR